MSDYQSSITYFRKPGKENTSKVLELSLLKAKELGISTAIVASTTGYTAKLAVETLEGMDLFIVTHSTGLRDPDEQEFDNEIKTLYKKGKIKAVRIHSAGDFYSQKYIRCWISVIKRNPGIKFFAYTKNINKFNFLALKSLKNMALVDSLKFGPLNYGTDAQVSAWAKKGAFICSGIIEEQKSPVLKKMEQLGFGVIEILTQEDWVSIACKLH